MDYTRLTPEELAALESFQGYITGKDPESVAFWQAWAKEHPEKSGDLAQAGELVRLFCFKSQATAERFQQDRARLESSLAKMGGETRAEAEKPSFSVWQNWAWQGSIAAAFALLLVAIAVFWGRLYWAAQNEQPVAVVEASWEERTAQHGQKLTIVLADGSRVKLNAGSTLRYPTHFSETLREVTLSGEAFFEVAEDPERPFVVKTNYLITKVLGTSFNIKSYPGEGSAEVALVTGKVQVNSEADAQASLILAPNQMAKVQKNGKLVRRSFDAKALAWKDGVLYFDKADISEIAEKLARWYNVEIEIDPAIGETAFSGEFNNQTLLQVLDGLSFSLPIEYSVVSNNKKVVLKRK